MHIVAAMVFGLALIFGFAVIVSMLLSNVEKIVTALRGDAVEVNRVDVVVSFPTRVSRTASTHHMVNRPEWATLPLAA
jgi:hypothetical protein